MIDCVTRDERVHGFPYSQLINYVLEANTALQSNRDAPPERLTIGFSSHDVVVLGWRIRALTTLLHDAKVGTIRTIDVRYGNLSNVEPFIAEITVTPIKSSVTLWFEENPILRRSRAGVIFDSYRAR